jgi:dTDP-4-dehydrorhamnose reductase
MFKKKIILIGSSGSLGKQIISTLLSKKRYALKKVSRKDFNYIKNFKKLEKVIHNFKPNFVINCAALAGMLICKNKVNTAFETNFAFPAKLADLINKKNIKLIHFSTECVFEGKKKNKIYSEKDFPKPLSIYGTSKYLGEIAIGNKKNTLIIRLPLLYGPTHHNNKQIVGRLLENLKCNKKINVAKDVFSTPVFSPHVSEFIHFIISNKKKFFKRKLIHLTTNNYLSMYDLLKKLVKPIDKTHLIIGVKDSFFGHDSLNPKNFGLKSNYKDCYLPHRS